MTALTATQAATIARAIAAENQVVLDQDALDAAVARLSTDLGLADDRSLAFEIAVPFEIKGGRVVDARPLEHARAIVREFGKPIPKAPEGAPTAPVTASSAPQWAQISRGPVSDVTRTIAAAQDARTVRETEIWANPWQAGPNHSRTRQAVMTNRNPALADKYKNKTGLRYLPRPD